MLLQIDIQIQNPGDAQLVDNLPIPDFPDAYVKIKVIVMAVAPLDWQQTHRSATKNEIEGFGYAGAVKEVGSNLLEGFKRTGTSAKVGL